MKTIFCSFWCCAAILLASAVLAQETPKAITAGVVNGKAKSLPVPVYPAAAQAVRASGMVNVQVTIDENGEVISAAAVSGHPLLRASAVEAARGAKFTPTMLSGQPVKVTGVIVYNFASALNWQHVGAVLGGAENEIENTDSLSQIARDLEGKFPNEAASLKAVVANVEKDAADRRKQSSAVGEVINSLHGKIAGNVGERWYFELGLAKARMEAAMFDDVSLRNNLPKLRELFDLASGNTFNVAASRLETLRELADLAGKTAFSGADKKKIAELLRNL